MSVNWVEIYVGADQAGHIFETLWDASGSWPETMWDAYDGQLPQKAFRHFGHDITTEDNVIAAGLGFAVSTKEEAFIGRDAVLRTKENGPESRMVQFLLNDPELLYHNEPILQDGKIVGYLSRGLMATTWAARSAWLCPLRR